MRRNELGMGRDGKMRGISEGKMTRIYSSKQSAEA